MIELSLIGIGSGAADHPTLQALAALRAAQLVLVPRKGEEKSELAQLRRALCASHLDASARVVEFDMPRRDAATAQYLDGVLDWHARIAGIWAELLRAQLPRGGRAALLVWGDPALYDSSLRVAGRLRDAGLALRVRVIPGLSSVQLLTAAHAIGLNTLGGSVLITTGRRLREAGWPDGVETVVVMLDADCAFRQLPPTDLHIYWGAYLGMPQQQLLRGPLAQTAPHIVEARALARARHGWIMDVYLLRRGSGPDADIDLA